MTRKQQAWLDSIAQGFSPDEAARRAGYRGDSAADFRRIGKRNQQRFSRRPADDAPDGWQGSSGSARGFAGRSEAGDSGAVGFLEGQNHSYKELKACADEIPKGEKTVPDEVLQEPADGGVGDDFHSLKELKGSPKKSGECPPESMDGCAGEQNNALKELKGHEMGDWAGDSGLVAPEEVSETAALHTEPDWPGERSSELGWTEEEPLEKGAVAERDLEPAAAKNTADSCVGCLNNSYKELKGYKIGDSAGEQLPEPDWPGEEPLEKRAAGAWDPEPAAIENLPDSYVEGNFNSLKELKRREIGDRAGEQLSEPDWPGEQPLEKGAAREWEPGSAAHEATIQAVVAHMEPGWPREQPLEKRAVAERDPEPAATKNTAALKNAGMDEIGAFWSAIIRDPHADRKDRLKASELLARACGGFLDRADLSGALTVVIYGDNFIPD